MNIQLQGNGTFITSNSLLFGNSGSKSTQERLERQTTRDNKVAFYEAQKENLKNMECDSLEDISKKLEMFHSYDDQIAAAKKEFNNSQMMHVADEAREWAEKVAKAAEKNAPKTAEERQEERVEEALGTDENESGLTEILEELSNLAEETAEVTLEELPEESLRTEEELEESLQSEEELRETLNEEIIPVSEQITGQYKRIDFLV